MAFELLAAVGVALLALWLVFGPLIRDSGPDLSVLEPEAAEETRRGVALLALKEIEFDRETGKLTDADYALLKTRYGEEALEAMAEEERAVGAETLVASRRRQLFTQSAAQSGPLSCTTCGPRPELDAVYCSQCGRSLTATAYCAQCGAMLPAESHFCAACGSKVAA